VFGIGSLDEAPDGDLITRNCRGDDLGLRALDGDAQAGPGDHRDIVAAVAHRDSL